MTATIVSAKRQRMKIFERHVATTSRAPAGDRSSPNWCPETAAFIVVDGESGGQSESVRSAALIGGRDAIFSSVAAPARDGKRVHSSIRPSVRPSRFVVVPASQLKAIFFRPPGSAHGFCSQTTRESGELAVHDRPIKSMRMATE